MADQIETTEEFEERGETEEVLPYSEDRGNHVRPKGVTMGEGCYWVRRGARD
jgi:hypothetical protein